MAEHHQHPRRWQKQTDMRTDIATYRPNLPRGRLSEKSIYKTGYCLALLYIFFSSRHLFKWFLSLIFDWPNFCPNIHRETWAHNSGAFEADPDFWLNQILPANHMILLPYVPSYVFFFLFIFYKCCSM